MTEVILILGVVAAMLALQSLIFLAHHLQSRMGTMPLGALLGAGLYGMWVFAGSVPLLRISGETSIALLSVIVYANVLSSLLMVYICDGTNYARRLLAVLLGVSVLSFALQGLMRLALQVDAIFTINPVPLHFFSYNWRIIVSATTALVVAFLLVIFLYQLFTNRLSRLPRGLRISLVLGLVLIFDGMLYTTLGFAGGPRYLQYLLNQIFTKLATTLVLAPGLVWYVTRVLRTQAASGSEGRPVFDVVGRVTEMDREMETVFATMLDGLILLTMDGVVARASRSAERLFGRELTGLRLDDPALRMTFPDGTLFPLSNSPLTRTLQARKPVENVELGIRQEDGSIRIISLNASPVLDSKGRMRGALATFRDVTQRKQIDESLAASQDFLKRLIDQAPTGIAVFDRQGHAEHLNKAFLDLLGFSSPNELIGEFNVFKEELFRESDLVKYFVQAFKGRVVEIPPKCFDLEHKRVFDMEKFSLPEDATAASNGNIKVISQSLFPVYDRLGKVHSVVALATDLTERAKAELSRQRIDQRYQDVVSRLSDYLFSARVVHGGLQYEFCTPAVEKVTGYPEQFFLSDNWFWFTIIDQDDKQRVQEELRRLFEKRDIHEGAIEYRIRPRRGDSRWVLSRFTFLRNFEGKVERVIGLVSDISNRKETEEALRKTVSKLRTLVETMHDLVVTLDLEGKVTYANQTLNQILAFAPRALLGHDFYEFAHPEDREAFAQKLRELAASEQPLRKHETRLQTSKGEYLWLIINADPLYDEEGKLNGMIIVASDITERKRSEEAIRQRNVELLLINHLSQKFRATSSLQEVFGAVYALLPHAMGIHAATIRLWDDERRELVSLDEAGGDQLSFAPQNGALELLQKCYDTRAPVIVNDCEADGQVDPAWVKKHGTKSTAVVPILSDDRALGVLQVEDHQEKNRFTAESVFYLEIVTKQLAVAIQNAHLYESLRQSEGKYRSLYEQAQRAPGGRRH